MGRIRQQMSQLRDIIRRHARKLLLSSCLSVFITIFWTSVEAAMLALLILASIGLLVWAMTSQIAVKTVRAVFKNEKRTRIVLTLALVIVLVWLEGFVFRTSIVSLITPDTTSTTVVYVDVTEENLVVRQYTDPEYKRQDRTYDYALLVEFRVNHTPERIDIEIDTGEAYGSDPIYDYGMRNDSSVSRPPSDPRGGMIIGSFGLSVEEVNPPIYRLRMEHSVVEPSLSFYVYFEGDKPMQVVTTRFGDTVFALQDNILVPIR